jgi:hypothetical protein
LHTCTDEVASTYSTFVSEVASLKINTPLLRATLSAKQKSSSVIPSIGVELRREGISALYTTCLSELAVNVIGGGSNEKDILNQLK